MTSQNEESDSEQKPETAESSMISSEPLDSTKEGLATDPTDAERQSPHRWGLSGVIEFSCLLLIFMAFAGAPAPMVNESHYLVKAKSYWDPDWCQNDLFVASGKAHVTFYYTIGWLTQYFSLETTAWIGRLFGWSLIAIGLSHLSWNLFRASYLCLPMAIIWMAAIDYGNLAGEWVIGGIEGKVPAFGLVLYALGEMINRRWNQTWILLGCASAFHVLTGGWSVLAAMVAWFWCERKRERRQRLFHLPLIAGGMIAMFGLVPALSLQAGASAEDTIRAARIYTFYRLPHHLVPSSFELSWYLRHGVLIATVVVMMGRSRISPYFQPLIIFVVFAFGLSCIGFAIGMTIEWNPDLAAGLLRYYWFRLSDAMIPLLFACLVTNLLDRTNPFRLSNLLSHNLAIAVTALCGGLLANDSILRARIGVPPAASNRVVGFEPDATDAEQQTVFRDWLAVCSWARQSSDSDEVFLTPRHQQTFKWYAERAEVANWKDVPQDAASLVEWHERFHELYPQRLGYRRVTIQYPSLRNYRERFGTRWMIVDRRIVGEHLPLVRVYPLEGEENTTYAVYELPTAK
jgi:hypothetical protein